MEKKINIRKFEIISLKLNSLSNFDNEEIVNFIEDEKKSKIFSKLLVS